MFSLKDLKLWFHLENLTDKENRYKDLLNRIELLKSQQNDLIEEHESIKKNYSIKLKNIRSTISSKEEADNLSKAINQRYNKSFKGFIDELSKVKKEYNKVEAQLEKISKDEKFEKAQKIKDEEFLKSFLIIADLYSKGKIKEEVFQKIKSDIIKGGYAIGTVRNWADGKYRKDREDVWTKISEETSGSGASLSAIKSKLGEFPLYQLDKKLKEVPEKYATSRYAEALKEVHAAKMDYELKSLGRRSIADLEAQRTSILGRSYYEDDRKAFHVGLIDKVIQEKKDLELLSPMELEAKGYSFPVGTVRDWQDGKYIKEADGTWRKMPEFLGVTEVVDLKTGEYVTIVENDGKGGGEIIAEGYIVSTYEKEDEGKSYTTRIIVEDEETEQRVELSVDDLLQNRIFRGTVSGFFKRKMSAFSSFPSKIEKLKTSKPLGGSSGVQMVEWAGKYFALKTAREKDSGEKQLKLEHIANTIYADLGIKAPNGRIYEGGRYLLNEFLEGKELSKVFYNSNREKEKVKRGIQDGFVLDALLGNWDVIGGAEDNIIVDKDFNVYRIDNGGVFYIRARGGTKDFGPEVAEIDTLRKHNPKWFGDISDEEIHRQIQVVLENQSDILDHIRSLDLPQEEIDTLVSTLEQRMESLKKWKSKDELIDKGEYESGVTNKYFKDWNDIKVPETIDKEALKRNIVEKEKQLSSRIKDFAKSRNISVEEYKKLLQERVEEIVNNTEFFITASSRIVDKIVNTDNRFLSQFESSVSGGMFGPDRRAQAEEILFGTRRTIEKNNRCIYGYWSDNINGVINREGKNPPPNKVEQYGNITFKVDREFAMKNATITFGDSLDWDFPPEKVPVLASKPHFISLFTSSIYDSDPLEKFQVKKIHTWQGSGYTECQYHGGLSMDNITSVHFSHGNNAEDSDVNNVIESLFKYSIKSGRMVIPKYYSSK